LSILLCGAVFLLAIIAEVPYVNGPAYWAWPYRRLDFGRALEVFAAPLLLYGYLAQRGWSQRELTASEARRLLFGLVCCSLLLMGAGLHMRPKALHFTLKFVHHAGATGYFTDALKIGQLTDFLRDYHALPRAPHSVTHPPGPVLFWWLCIRLAGDTQGVFLGTALLALGASLAVLPLYAFGTLWTEERRLRLAPCFLWVLLPGLIANLPELDQVYPILSMLTLLSWRKALQGSARARVALGLWLFALSFTAYNLLTLGVAMLAIAALGCSWRSLARSIGGALGTCLGAYLLLWLTTGYDPVKTFLNALEAQRGVSLELGRPYAPALFWAPYDFVLAAGMLVLPLLVLHLRERTPGRRLTVWFLLAILVIDVSGLLPCETARIWLFLQPLVLVPAGLQLARFRPAERGWVLALQAVIVMVMRCKLEFFP
jgi:hypothetical protein